VSPFTFHFQNFSHFPNLPLHRALPHRPEIRRPCRRRRRRRRRSLSLGVPRNQQTGAPTGNPNPTPTPSSLDLSNPAQTGQSIADDALSLSNGLLRRPLTRSPMPLKPSSLFLATSRPDLRRSRRRQDCKLLPQNTSQRKRWSRTFIMIKPDGVQRGLVRGLFLFYLKA
jgi:hypothetical protein